MAAIFLTAFPLPYLCSNCYKLSLYARAPYGPLSLMATPYGLLATPYGLLATRAVNLGTRVPVLLWAGVINFPLRGLLGLLATPYDPLSAPMAFPLPMFM